MITIAICDDKKDDTDLIESYVMASFEGKKNQLQNPYICTGKALLEPA